MLADLLVQGGSFPIERGFLKAPSFKRTCKAGNYREAKLKVAGSFSLKAQRAKQRTCRRLETCWDGELALNDVAAWFGYKTREEVFCLLFRGRNARP